jgi:hypothetical protein
VIDYDESQVISFVQQIEPLLPTDLGRLAVNVARMQWDACNGMGYTASRAKHLAELQAEVHPPPPLGPLPPVPTRDQILTGQFTLQGLRITIDGVVYPWWSACWAWLTQAQRQQAAPQLLAAGEQIILIAFPNGLPLYDEGAQFYSPDKFPAKAMGPDEFANLVAESLGYGFPAAWVFWDENHGPASCLDQTRGVTPAFGARGLNDYILQVPTWDGGWHKPDATGTGWNPPDIAAFAEAARAVGAKYLGFEHGTGYMLAGGGRRDYAPGGVMADYDLILGEFNDEQLDVDDCWQILARYLGPAYHRPANQPAADDPGAPFGANAPQFALAGTDKVYRVFERMLYGDVRGRYTSERVLANKRRFEALGATHVC